LVLGLTIPGRLHADRIYIANDDHTDYMWSGNEVAFRQAFLGELDYYIGRMQATAGEAPKNQARFNADGTFWIWEYEHNRSAAELATLVSWMKSGHLNVAMNPLVLTYGAQPAEAVLRGLYYGGNLERRFGVHFPTALAMENQTLPFGLATLWAGAGVKYAWHGQCGCGTKVPNPSAARPYQLYHWTGRDGSKVLMKWYQLRGNADLGGYAELNQGNPNGIDLTAINAKCNSTGYSYDVAGAFGRGWDALWPGDPGFTATTIFEQVAKANANVTLSNEADFFADVESNYSTSVPDYGASFGNEWDLLPASVAELSARVRRSIEKLRAAEALASLATTFDTGFMDGRASARAQAFMDMGLYFEHDWTADGPISKQDRLTWQRTRVANIEGYVNTLYDDGLQALGALVPKGAGTRVVVFNPLGWARTDVVDVAYSSPGPVQVIDGATGAVVPSQLISVAGQTHLQWIAGAVPSLGYRFFSLDTTAGQSFTLAATASVVDNVGTLDGDSYSLKLDGTGTIISLVDKTRGNREFVQAGLNVFSGQLGSGTVTVESQGPVRATLVATSTNPARTARVSLLRGSLRVEIENQLTQSFSDVRTWGFGLNVTNPDTWHEEIGAVIRAKTLTDGGHYCPNSAISRYDWQSLNHFVDMTGAEGVGVTLSNADCLFSQLGTSSITHLDTTTARVSVLAGGQIDAPLGIPNQGGDTNFLQRFAVTTHDQFDQAAAMRFALEHQNPLIATLATGGDAAPLSASSGSLVVVSDPHVLVWTLKPAEDGASAGLVVRLWNMGDSTPFTLAIPGRTITQATRTSHVETPIEAATVSDGKLTGSIGAQQMLTFALVATPATGGSDGGVPDTGVPVTVPDAGGPVTVLDSDAPVKAPDAAAPVTVHDAGGPVTVLDSGAPVKAPDAVAPVAGIDAGLPVTARDGGPPSTGLDSGAPSSGPDVPGAAASGKDSGASDGRSATAALDASSSGAVVADGALAISKDSSVAFQPDGRLALSKVGTGGGCSCGVTRSNRGTGTWWLLVAVAWRKRRRPPL
jgi:alpha-mannosidase